MPTRSVHEDFMDPTIGAAVRANSPRDQDGLLPTPEECLTQINRLLRSPLFMGSEALCKLLKYLAHHTIHTPADHLKEYEIATEAFGRPADFDPQTDSYVRVQMGRLRTKLTSYYETEGATDPVMIDVPKGRYLVLFERRAIAAEPLPAHPVDVVPPVDKEQRRSKSPWRGWRLPSLVAAVILLVGMAAVGLEVFHQRQFAESQQNKPQHVLTMFWTPFLQGTDEPIVVFANANFVGDAETGMRYFEPSRDQHTGMTQHYTGVGEVMGVLKLDRLLEEHGRQFHVKRSSLFTLDDARNNNLIFVGSPTENLTLGQIPGTQEFVFRHIEARTDRWQEVIVNTHPQAGESPVYAPSGESANEGEQYAVIALRRGLDPARWTMILAGASTIGTQAAVDYACDSGSVENLLKRLNVSKSADLKPFEGLLRVHVANDVPLAVQLVALRQIER